MVFGNDAMLQIVPSAGFSPPSSTEYSAEFSVESFDLSLLSSGCDNEVPFSPNTTDMQQVLSLYYDSNSPPPAYQSYDANSVKLLSDDSSLKNQDELVQQTNSFSEKSIWNYKSLEEYPNKCFTDNKSFYDDETMLNKNSFLDMEMVDWNQKFEWDTFRPQPSITSGSSSSSCSSPDFNCPPTPSDLINNIIPLEDIKTEITLDIESLLNDNEQKPKVIKKKTGLLRSILEKSPLNDYKKTTIGQNHINQYTENDFEKCRTSDDGDHKLLREVLTDTSFQKKYNLKPINIEGLGMGYQPKDKTTENESKTEHCMPYNIKDDSCDVNMTEGIISPILSRAIEQLMQNVDNTCFMLGIPRDPRKWSVEDVRNWLLWNSKQYNVSRSLNLFNIDGSVLVTMTEQDFQQRAPHCGSMLFAQLELWKLSSMEDTHLNVNNLLCEPVTPSASPSIDRSDDDEDEDDEMCGSNFIPQSNLDGIKPAVKGGAHIHLWQFLKELLSSPKQYGACIRWLDRTKGVFKIEDSVRVARLWGKRKNRPAMNYDKLSRSIRQYYKKGIMKKTERSQRLVYQFCTPYSL